MNTEKPLNDRASSSVSTLAGLIESITAAIAHESSARDHGRMLAHKEIRLLASSGLLTMRIPVEFGGPGAGFVQIAKLFVALGQADPNVAQAVLTHFGFIERLMLTGSPEQKRHYFELIRKGHVVAGAFAERGGKFVGDITTRLSRHGDRYRLSGRKYYCTGSLYADSLNILAIDDDGGRVIAVCPVDRAGLTMVDDWDGMGQRTTASGTVTMDDVVIEPSEVLEFTAGLERRTHLGSSAQLIHAAIDTGIALAALADAMKFAREKARPVPESGVDKAADDPYVLHAVGEMAVVAHGAVAMINHAADILEQGANSVLAGETDNDLLSTTSIVVAEAKAIANDACLRVSEWLYRVGGASATSQKLNFDRHWRNARTHTTHDPVAYKYKAIADFYMNGRLPPISTKI
ncbi:MAG: acyl-CoA dehydrogenase family protein [Reyranellaceae bacterium]